MGRGVEKSGGKLVVICGPTATGKSGLALAIAQRLQLHGTLSAILSADSRQVYCSFDIGTAKPGCEDLAIAPHHLIDICKPTETLTLGDFQQRAQGLIAAMHQEQTLPLLVGGTGLYIKSVVRGMKIPRVPPQPELRSQLTALGQRHNYAQLAAVDAIAAQKIHPNDRVRTLRALEVFYVTGQTISSQQGEEPPDYAILQIGLDCLENNRLENNRLENNRLENNRLEDSCFEKNQGSRQPDEPRKDRLTQRIRRRSRLMVEQGFVAEVEGLCDRYGPDLPLLNTLGYAEMRRHLRGEIDLEEAIDLTALHTRQFAKRQRTWFRAIPEIEWFDADDPKLEHRVWKRIQEFI